MSTPDYDQELIEVFTQESKEHMDALEPALLELEENPEDKGVINLIFRAVHSVKGASGFFGLTAITELSHSMENLMSLVRDGDIKSNGEMINIFLAATDKLCIMIDDVDNSTQVDFQTELKRLKDFINGDSSAAALEDVTINKDKLPEPLRIFELDLQQLKRALKYGQSVYVIQMYTHKDIKDKGKIPLDLFKEIESLGEFMDCVMDTSEISGFDTALKSDVLCHFLFTTIMQPDLLGTAFDISSDQIQSIDKQELSKLVQDLPEVEEAPQETAPIAQEPKEESETENFVPKADPDLIFGTIQDEVIREVQPRQEAAIEIEKESELELKAPVQESVTPEQKPMPTAKAKSTEKSKASEETVRVSVSLLDDLMNLAGEMVLGRNQLMRITDSVAKDTQGLPGVLQNISLITSELQEKVMNTRLQPLGTILGKFKRIIRDLSQKLNKEIQLEIRGEDVELDKSIVEALSDPLTHLIRNCADHAIETPEERGATGKPACGTVNLSASHVGGQVHIEIRDDGRGLNPEKLKEKAIDKGVITKEEAENLSTTQIQNLIFHPGFSTAEKVSDVSGRGVGMDVVKTNIEKLGGSIELESDFGSGTRICLKLPLTLAIIPAMIIGVKERRFAVPQVNLEEIVRVGKQHKIEYLRNSNILRLRGKLLPVMNLEQLLDLNYQDLDSAKDIQKEKIDNNAGYVLVLKDDQHRYGLWIHELFDNEEIVVKPLSSYFKTAKCYSGITIMGDGEVAMILDPSGIANISGIHLKGHTNTDEKRDEAIENQEQQSILLFKNGTEETFTLNLAMVSRIEMIKASQIEHIGSQEFIKYQDTSLRLLRLHEFMPIDAPQDENEILYIIIPKLIKKPMGIVATSIEDIIHANVELDETTVSGTGILGSAIINKNLILFIDVYQLFELADPENYQRMTPTVSLADKRILLAEDTPFFRAVGTQFLKDHFNTVDVANDGQEAWDKLEENDYDLVLTDIEMPNMDGLELTKRIRASSRHSKLPVVALTSLSSEKDKEKATQAGVSAYETKLNKENLQVTLEGLLENN